MKQLKPVYSAATEEAALENLTQLEADGQINIHWL